MFQKCILVLTLLSFAQTTLANNPEAKRAKYLKSSPEEYYEMTAPFPKDGSNDANNDLKTVLEWQSTRTDQQCQTATEDADVLPAIKLFHFDKGYLTEKQYKKVSPLINAIAWDMIAVFYHLKREFDRPRPFVTHKQVSPCAPTERTASYPSGHAAFGRVFAKVLAHLAPSKAEALLARGEEIGDLRMIAGVHYPSDVQAGRDLAEAMLEEMFANKKFLQDLKSYKLE